MPFAPLDVRYARSGDVSIAYRVIGEGDRDLLFVHGLAGNLEAEAQAPDYVTFYERLSRFSRMIKFDRRGTGLSDRVRETPSLETRMDDVRAVLDAVGAHRAALFGTHEAAAICMLFASSYPERTSGLVLYNPVAKGSWGPDYPWAMTLDESRRQLAYFGESWGSPEFVDGLVREMAPTRSDDDEFKDRVLRNLRLGASPSSAQAIARMATEIDIRDVLPAIRVPTLILAMPEHRDEARFVADRIPDARMFEVAGPDFFVTLLGDDAYDEVERFVRGLDAETEPETVLATILFTDIADSTKKLAELGDRGWAELVSRHHSLVRRNLDAFRGTEIDTAGDGFFASFEGPLRAIRCARAISESVRSLGVEVRAGLHTGECERVDGKIGGLAVNIGARVAAAATPGELLVSSTVKDLVAGSAVAFEDRGTHELKGVPGEWRLYAVTSA
ncbi:MAG: alpha/beta fold hydrolase [Actinobacteria bacterium]|nr:alpha/beta fold hydrolase [Actinomycetota bacterium]